MKLPLAVLTLCLVGRAFAQRQDSYCRADEYPRGVRVSNGKVLMECAKMECERAFYPKCNKIFFELSCKQKQWVGGVPAESDLGGLVPLQCCEVPELRAARDIGVRQIDDGSYFLGQQLRDNKGSLVAFDVVKNIQKSNGGLMVYVARMRCKGKGTDSVQFQRRGFGSPEQFGSPERRDNVYGDDYGTQGDEGQVERVVHYIEEPQEGARVGAYEEPGRVPPPVDRGPLEAYIAEPIGQPALPPPGPGLGALAAPAAAAVGAAGGGVCFASDTTVETPSGPKTMEDLKVGDQVLTVEDGIQKFAPVTDFIHRLPNTNAKFHHIVAEDGTSLKLTQEHFIYTAECDNLAQKPQLKFARDVKPGDCWIKVDSELQTQRRVPVISNTIIRQTGAYAPLTENGVIVTDGILSSCYAVYKNDEFMDSFVYYANLVKNLFGGLFDLVGSHLPEGVTELPWLVSYGQTYMDNLIISSK